MSRIAKKPLMLPDGVTAKVEKDVLAVKGKHGELSLTFTAGVSCALTEDGKGLVIERDGDDKQFRALQGTFFRLAQNMVVGVSEQFSKKLEIVGVGYRAQLQGKKIVFQIGFCHPVEFALPEGISAELPSQTEIILTGIDKHTLGQAAANIRAIRKPEPYKGKGIRYTDEVIQRKSGKSVAGAK